MIEWNACVRFTYLLTWQMDVSSAIPIIVNAIPQAHIHNSCLFRDIEKKKKTIVGGTNIKIEQYILTANVNYINKAHAHKQKSMRARWTVPWRRREKLSTTQRRPAASATKTKRERTSDNCVYVYAYNLPANTIVTMSAYGRRLREYWCYRISIHVISLLKNNVKWRREEKKAHSRPYLEYTMCGRNIILICTHTHRKALRIAHKYMHKRLIVASSFRDLHIIIHKSRTRELSTFSVYFEHNEAYLI